MSDNDNSVTSATFNSQRNPHPVEALTVSHKVCSVLMQLGATVPTHSAHKHPTETGKLQYLPLPHYFTGFQLFEAILHIYKI